jgi:signal recognition particle subunit SRP19
MKEYDHCIVWLDYFDSVLKRREGRRVPLSAATKSPKIEELAEACHRLGLTPTSQVAVHPRSHGRESGYVAVSKSGSKHALLLKVARELAVVRGMAARKTATAPSGHKK